MSSIQKLLTENGKPMIAHLGYFYTKGNSTTQKTFFDAKIEPVKASLLQEW